MKWRRAWRALLALPTVARIVVADLKPDDVIIFECHERPEREAIILVKEQAKAIWPHHRILVLDATTVSMKIARPAADVTKRDR